MRRKNNKLCVVVVIFISLFLLVNNVFAKKIKVSHNEPSDIAGVDAIESTYHALTDFSAKFVQTTKVELVDRTVTKKGTFCFKKGGKIRIEYEGSGGKTYISDGLNLWTFVRGDEASLQTFAVNNESVPKEALSFMGGFGRLKKEFSVSSSDAFKDAPAATPALHLVPRSKAKYYESLDALFGANHLLLELIVKNTSGNVSHYNFSDIRIDTNLPDSLFTLPSGKSAN